MEFGSAFLVGRLLGGLFLIFVLFAVWEYVLFKRVFDDPLKGKTVSVIAAYFTAAIVYGFGSANGGPFNPAGFASYLFGAIVVGVFAVWRGMKLRDQIANAESVDDTFA